MTARACEAAPAALGEDNGYCFRHEDSTGTTSAPSKWRQLRAAKDLLPDNGRFQLCHDAAQNRAHGIGVYVKGKSAWLNGVIRCGSVWVCPVCSRRVSELRKVELQEAIDNAVRSGNGVILVTLTFPHGAGDELSVILEKFSKAQRFFKSGRAAVKIREELGFIGEIRALEVTHGQNGWHPHAHSIWVLEKNKTQEELEAIKNRLYSLWRIACLNKKVCLPEPSLERGVDVRGARNAAEYVAKWGFATEIAGTHSKRGKHKGRTPWQLLADATDGDKRSAWLWREFAKAFFGKRQIFWSRGLRKKLQIAPELTEQELMELDDQREKQQQIVFLDLDSWYVLRKSGRQEELLHYAVHDRAAMYGLLNFLRQTVPMENGKICGPREDWEQ